MMGTHMRFIPEFKQSFKEPQNAIWFLYQDEKLVVRVDGDSVMIPTGEDLKQGDLTPDHHQYLGTLDGRPCIEARGLRELFGALEEEYIWIAGRANQLVDWNQSHRYCGRCSTPTEDKHDERAKICPGCGLINYPRLSPAIIVAVRRDDRLLLARNQRFRNGFYSVLAGFVEPGETLEDCVKREVFEEVNIRVKNIRYFGSQPWPFPNSLMVGFTADYAGGEIDVNKSEIVEAAWFAADNLPRIPPTITIARWLIDWFKENV